MSLFLLCGYYPSYKDLAPVKIIGIFNSYEEAKEIQKDKCGCRIKLNDKCWQGDNGLITWIFKTKIGILETAIDIRETYDAMPN
jgi:hypothetical protein